jgi:hypothetical protein
MGNGKKNIIFRNFLSGAPAQSGGKNQFQLELIKVYILEMEDVLFHLNSAVMMPKAPEGASSTDGGGATPAQTKVSGIEALAMVFRQFEFDENKRLLISAHTDTSGEVDFNFKLSDLRAQNTLYLLDGNREEWAKVSESRHKIEDYQEIMTYMCTYHTWKWECDPGGVTDKWNDDTDLAIRKFIDKYNNWALNTQPHIKDIGCIDPLLADQIKKDSKHRWPIEMWRAVHDIYTVTLADILDSNLDTFEKDYRPLLKFVMDEGREYKYVACGESFPIDSAEKSNYRSQSNRRVVFLFFDKEEVPHMDCPAQIKTVHKATECPIWHKKHFLPAYINPNDLHFDEIAINFCFNNGPSNTRVDMPDGLKIKILEDGIKPIPFRLLYRGVTYFIKIHKNPSRTRLDLSFEAPGQYVDCSDPAAPKIVTKSLEELATMHFNERAKYYDLPMIWQSKNWMVKRSDKWVKFDDTILDFKGSVIEVYLDHTVLVDTNMNPERVTSSDRFTIFDQKLQIINKDTNQGYLTAGTVDKNLFSSILLGYRPRLFACNGNFYDCTNKRLYKGDYIGIRAAVKNDPDVHFFQALQHPVIRQAGNFDLHYLKDCIDPDGKGVDGLLVYWSCRITPDSDVSASSISDIEKDGFTNVKVRWEQKKNRFITVSDPQNRKLSVMPRFFFERRENRNAKCHVRLHQPTPGNRSNMGLTSSSLKTNDFFGQGLSTMEDGVGYPFLTASHEFGHAMGLDDEYRESISDDTIWNPSLPRFSQYYPGMPYGMDNGAIMVINQIPRMRNYWYFCRWVNETAEVKRLTGNTTFQIESGRGKNRKYSLKPEMNNFYAPANSEEDCRNGGSGRYDLHLYKCGQDETTDLMVTGQTDMDSILLVKIKLQFFFQSNEGIGWPDDDAELNYMRQFQNRIDNFFNKKFYLESSTDADFKKVYIHFVPHYHYGRWATSEHFEITVRANNRAEVRYEPDYFRDGYTSDSFTIDQEEDIYTIMRYMLGLQPYILAGARKIRNSNLLTDDLNFLATWLSSKRGSGGYTVRR